MPDFDYILCGGGLAGRSLAYLLSKSTLRHKKVLLIDREPHKTANDRTWAFWETQPGPFEALVHRRWRQVWFHGTGGFGALLGLGPFTYKCIRGDDFYRFTEGQFQGWPQLHRLAAEVTGVTAGADGVQVHTSRGVFSGKLCFDSIPPLRAMRPFGPDLLPRDPAHRQAGHPTALLQHFKGLKIRANRPVFVPEEAVLMDFRTPQHGDCRFFYVLPDTPTEALVEYTLFSDGLLEPAAYDEALQVYLEKQFRLKKEDYTLIESEWGVIPMSDEPPLPTAHARHVLVGTAGGYTRPATGYTFARTQRQVHQLVRQLEAHPEAPPRVPVPLPARYRFYDRVLLNVLRNRRHAAAGVFTLLYQKNPTERIFRFLDESSTFSEDFRVIWSAPFFPFLQAAADGLFSDKKQ